MRRILISLLLASAAASPAIAAPHNWAGRQDAQEDRQSAREERQSSRDDRQAAREDNSQSRDQSPSDNRSDRSSEARQYQQQQVQQHQQVQQRPVEAQQRQHFNGGAAERYYARPDRSNAPGRYQQDGGPAYVAPGPRTVTPGANFRQRQV